MLADHTDTKNHEPLIIDRESLCSQLEAGNPFLKGQNFVFSKNKGDICNKNYCLEPAHADLGAEVKNIIDESLKLSIIRSKKYPHSPAIANQLALDYMRNGDVDNAIKFFKLAIEIDGSFFAAKANLAKCYLKINKTEDSLKIYLELENRKIVDTKVLTNIGLIYFLEKDFDKANSYFKKAIVADPKNFFAINNIGLLKLSIGEINSAISYFRSALKFNEASYSINNNIGICFALKGEISKAKKFFEIAYSRNPSSRDVVSNLSSAYQHLGDHEKATIVLEKYLNANEYEVDLRNRLLFSYEKLGLHDKCLRELSRLLNIQRTEDPLDIPRILNNIGVVYASVRDFPRAREFFVNSVEKDPKHIIPFLNLIDLNLRSNNLDQAKEVIDNALLKFENDPILLCYLAEYYSHKYDFAKSRIISEKALEIEPNILTPYVYLSFYFMEIERNDLRAMEIARDGLDRFPDSVPMINNFACALINLGRLDEAKKVLDRVSDEVSVQLTATRGLLFIKEGKLDNGRYQYNKAVELARKDKNLASLVNQKKYLELGKYLNNIGKYQEALKMLNKGKAYKTHENYYSRQILSLIETIEGNLQVVI